MNPKVSIVPRQMLLVVVVLVYDLLWCSAVVTISTPFQIKRELLWWFQERWRQGWRLLPKRQNLFITELHLVLMVAVVLLFILLIMFTQESKKRRIFSSCFRCCLYSVYCCDINYLLIPRKPKSWTPKYPPTQLISYKCILLQFPALLSHVS